jgi:Flp pilus assembly pilin Flp
VFAILSCMSKLGGGVSAFPTGTLGTQIKALFTSHAHRITVTSRLA